MSGRRYLYALDLSMASTGLVIFDLDTFEPVIKCSIRTNSKETDGERLATIVNGIKQYAKEYPVTIVAIERGFTKFNTATQQLFRVHGVINYLFHKYPQVYYTPSSIKKAITGNGKAEKEAVLGSIRGAFPDEDFKDNGRDSDVSDAFAIGLTYLIDKKLIKWAYPMFTSTLKIKKTKKKKGTA